MTRFERALSGIGYYPHRLMIWAMALVVVAICEVWYIGCTPCQYWES